MTEAANFIGQASGACELGNAGITQDREMTAGNIFPQQSDRGERQDEVANGTTTDDEDSRWVHGGGSIEGDGSS